MLAHALATTLREAFLSRNQPVDRAKKMSQSQRKSTWEVDMATMEWQEE